MKTVNLVKSLFNRTFYVYDNTRLVKGAFLIKLALSSMFFSNVVITTFGYFEFIYWEFFSPHVLKSISFYFLIALFFAGVLFKRPKPEFQDFPDLYQDGSLLDDNIIAPKIEPEKSSDVY